MAQGRPEIVRDRIGKSFELLVCGFQLCRSLDHPLFEVSIEGGSLFLLLRESEKERAALNRDLEQRVIERTAELETANKELEAFSYSVSHDLRAPLRHIDSYAQILTDEAGPTLGEDNGRFLKAIANSARNMGQL